MALSLPIFKRRENIITGNVFPRRSIGFTFYCRFTRKKKLQTGNKITVREYFFDVKTVIIFLCSGRRSMEVRRKGKVNYAVSTG